VHESHAVLFEPIRIGCKTLPNRFYQVPHASGFGVIKPRSQAAFRAIKAEGGWGGVCVEYAPVSRDSEETPAIAANLWDDNDAAALALTVEQVHAHGALAGLELFHGGAESDNGESRLPQIAPTALSFEDTPWTVPKEMTFDDIARVQREWVEAAERACDCGFDIVYVYGAHHYLGTQFLSPFFNKRRDRYGGSLENRARFWLETLEAVRAAVGTSCAIATRIGVDHRGEPGVTIDEALQFIAMADPLVDLFDVNTGNWSQDSATARYFGEGHARPWTSQVRSATGKPIVSVGRYNNPDLMAELVRTRELDIIGAARPAIADPFLPRKIFEGRISDIRECTGSNVCILKEEVNRHIGCIQNPTAGEEWRRRWHPEIVPPSIRPERTFLVIGAGPAGLECALTLARREVAGVHLVEAADAVGGHLRWMRLLPTLGELGRVVDWRQSQLERLPNVKVITGKRLGLDDVLDYGANVAIVATGSLWRENGLQFSTHEPIAGLGGSHADVLTPEQIMAGGRLPSGDRVVVYDAEGYLVGPGVAERLRDAGFDVTLVTPLPEVSPVSDETLEGAFLRQHLHAKGIAVHRRVTLHRLGIGQVSGTDEFGDEWSCAADSLVLVTQRSPVDALYGALFGLPCETLRSAGIEAVFRIGDAVAPRMTSEAVFDGHRLAMEIDSDDPSVPLPYDRDESVPVTFSLRPQSL
jgi:dimethylamine/trimethylamine dehydrogenase